MTNVCQVSSLYTDDHQLANHLTQVFVTWDPDIVPAIVSRAASYPSIKEPVALRPITDDHRADFFANYSNSALGRVKSLHTQWARVKGPLSQECQQLNRLFSQCVDGSDIRIPPSLQKSLEPPKGSQPFVLDALHAAAKKKIDEIKEISANATSSPEVLDLLVSRSNINLSEFDLIQFVLRWCAQNAGDFNDYVPFFDFSALTDEQKTWLLGVLLPEQRLPSVVRNGLLQSQLLNAHELTHYGLAHHGHHWKPIFNSSFDRMGRFLPSLCSSLDLFQRKFIVFRPDERLTLAIYIPKQIPNGSEAHVDTSVRVFAFPREQELDSVNYRVVPTKINYRLYCDDHAFQLYQEHKRNTFVFLTKGQLNDVDFKYGKSKGDKRRKKQETLDKGLNFDCIASIALDKISKGVQNHVGKLNRAGIAAAVSPIP